MSEGGIKPTITALPSDWKNPTEIKLRDEQKRFIAKTKEYFDSLSPKELADEKSAYKRQFLWNAKMRFGKTLCALELVRQMKFKRTLIITHRPTLKDQWFDDFNNIFKKSPSAKFGYRLDNETAKDREDKLNKGISEFDQLEKFGVQKEENSYVFFASMQYLRRSALVGGDDKGKTKATILNADWDMVIIDEAHEGTNTIPGQNVKDYLARPNTLRLELSGTPFNISGNFSSKQIESWDYVDEQKAKKDWNKADEQNPYLTLPRMNIMRYNLGAIVDKYVGQDGEFKFTEFFRVEEGAGNTRAGRFVHEEDVKAFLIKLRREDDNNYPFSNEEFRRSFAHTLWVVPRVAAAKALEELLLEDDVFKKFKIINVAGKNDDDTTSDDALEKVKALIDPRVATQPAKRSITISCGRLTTGVTVRQWTAVLYMKGSEMTSTATYMQTIFRVQSPYVFTDNNGKKWMKSECYAFDFAVNRALNMVTETAVFNTNIKNKKIDTEGKTRKEVEKAESKGVIREFLNYCDVMSLDGACLTPVDAEKLYARLNDVYIERIVRNGFDDKRLFNLDEIDKMTPEERAALGEDRDWLDDVTSGPVSKPSNEIPLDLDHLTIEQRAALDTAKIKSKVLNDYEEWWNELTELERTMATLYSKIHGRSMHPNAPKEDKKKKTKRETKEENEQDKLEKKQKKERESIISILKAVMVRIPLLIYGAELTGRYKDADITIDNITDIVDDDSWREFMPKKGNKEIDKEWFKKYKKYIHKDFFKLAGRRYRHLADEADEMHTEERIARIAEIFNSFRNPDKETVLTPWRVVNMHMSETLGGYCFFNEEFDGPNVETREEEVNGVKTKITAMTPRQMPETEVSRVCFGNIDDQSGESNTRILEINSKTGLYPLYVAYSIYRPLLDVWKKLCNNPENISVGEEQSIWDQVLRQNVFVVCKTEMARSITQRTLRGSRINMEGYPVQVNAVYPQWKVEDVKCRHEKSFSKKEKEIFEKASKGKLDLVDILRVDSKIFEKDVLNPEWWEKVDKSNKLKLDEKTKAMKKIRFDAVVGNPPYQLQDGGGRDNGASSALYDKFVNTAKGINAAFISMIIPAKWFSGGRGLDNFRNQMLEDNRLSIIYDFIDSRDCFPSVDLPGGVCFFLRGSSERETCEVITVNSSLRISSQRRLNEHAVFIREVATLEIINIIRSKVNKFISESVLYSDPFGFRSYVDGTKTKFDNSCELFTSRGISYVDKNSVQNSELIDKYKVIMSKAAAEHAGQTDKSGRKKVVAKLEILPPNRVSSESYLVIFTSDSLKEAENALKYVKTKFFRFLLDAVLPTQNIARDKFIFIPWVDFSETSDIPWTQSIAEIDNYLYCLFGIEDKKSYIESKIKDF